MSPLPYVPPRFHTAVGLHLVKNLLASDPVSPPLLMGIHGESGVGKSFQLDLVLKSIGVDVHPISSADLESDHANDPSRLLRKTYLAAAERMATGGVGVAAVVINDIDAALGDWGELVQYTVNRQLVIGELMHLCDRPQSVQGVPNERVPVFLTANDFTKLYGPLMRLGRMKLYHWAPQGNELETMVAATFPHLPATETSALVTRFSGETISFFAQLRSESIDDEILHLISPQSGSGLSSAESVQNVILSSRDNGLSLSAAPSFSTLLDIGQRLVAERANVKNYLTPSHPVQDLVAGSEPQHVPPTGESIGAGSDLSRWSRAMGRLRTTLRTFQ